MNNVFEFCSDIILQKQLITGVCLQTSYVKKIPIIYEKTPVMGSFFSKVEGPKFKKQLIYSY